MTENRLILFRKCFALLLNAFMLIDTVYRGNPTAGDVQNSNSSATEVTVEEEHCDAFLNVVEKGKQIKDRIRKLYNEKFTQEKLEREAALDNDVIQAANFINTNKNIDFYEGNERLNPTKYE
jgi:hypothetical protein